MRKRGWRANAIRRAGPVWRVGALAALAVMAGPARADRDTGAAPWMVYYAAAAPTDAFDAFGLLMLDSEAHPSLAELKDRGKVLLGYISLGEVASYRAWFDDLSREGLLLAENPTWKGSFYIDLRDRRWTKRVIEEIVPAILFDGFDGLFLDTLDNPIHLERTEPERYAGMTAAAARLVRTLRRHYPTISIMLNRAYSLLPEVEGAIDMALGESVYTDYDFAAGTYGRVDPETYRLQVELLTAARARRPELRVMTLDYWDPDDAEGIRHIYEVERANGFEPYVATVELDRIVPRPAP